MSNTCTELSDLCDELVGALKHCQIALRTHSPNVPEDEQCWTSYDEDAIEGAYEAIALAASVRKGG